MKKFLIILKSVEKKLFSCYNVIILYKLKRKEEIPPQNRILLWQKIKDLEFLLQ